MLNKYISVRKIREIINSQSDPETKIKNIQDLLDSDKPPVRWDDKKGMFLQGDRVILAI